MRPGNSQGLHERRDVISQVLGCVCAIRLVGFARPAQIERDAAHAFELRLIDRFVEIRIDCRLYDAEMINGPKFRLRNMRFDLFFRLAETKAEQLGRGGQFTQFLRALRGHSLGQQEEQQGKQEGSKHGQDYT